MKYLNLKSQDIFVNPNGYDKDLYLYGQQDLSIHPSLCLDKKYILYISRIEHPGKNHLRLIKAYELLPLRVKQTYSLVLIGNDCENAQLVHEYVQQSKYKDFIKFLGFVENKKMPSLISNAKIFVFPSLYEGFGIPLIEAMAMNVPTLCASNSSLLEIGKDVSLFFNEYDELSIKETMLKVLENKALQESMKKNGLHKVKQYNWSCHANNIIKLYEKDQLVQTSKTLC